MKDHAQKYLLDFGLQAFPVDEYKHPLIKFKQYQTEKITLELINTWWTKWPKANIGLITGKISNLFVIDIDSEEALRLIDSYIGDMKPTVKSPNGWHYYFNYCDCDLTIGSGFLTGCDFRGQGGYIVAAPSKTSDFYENEILKKRGGKYKLLESVNNRQAVFPDLLQLIKNYLGTAHARIRDPIERESTTSTTSTLSTHFKDGTRDDDIFHAAFSLAKGGSSQNFIAQAVDILSKGCEPPLSESEVKIKLESAFKRVYSKNRNWAAEVRDLISSTSGHISSTFIHMSLQLPQNDPLPRKAVSAELSRLVESGRLERSGKAGDFRIVEESVLDVDLNNINTKNRWLDLWLPFDLHNVCQIAKGSVIMFAGSYGAGKTTVLMNVCKYNMQKWNTHFLSTEINADEFIGDAELHEDMAIEKWRKYTKFKDLYDKSIVDNIYGGDNDLWIVDYFQELETPYAIAQTLRSAHAKLGGRGVLVGAIQKPPGRDEGYGGAFGNFIPNLSVSIEQGTAKILKCRNWHPTFKAVHGSPVGREYKYILVEKSELRVVRGSMGWQKPFLPETTKKKGKKE